MSQIWFVSPYTDIVPFGRRKDDACGLTSASHVVGLLCILEYIYLHLIFLWLVNYPTSKKHKVTMCTVTALLIEGQSYKKLFGLHEIKHKWLHIKIICYFNSMCYFVFLWFQMYITFTVKAKGTRLAKPVMSLGLMCLAFLTGINRVAEYRNHWSDVIAGFIIGVAIATFLVSFSSGVSFSWCVFLSGSLQTYNVIVDSHHLLALMSFQTFMIFFLLWNTQIWCFAECPGWTFLYNEG